jgi:hypothetical protein
MKKFAISLFTSLLFSLLISTIFGPVLGAVSFISGCIPKEKGIAMMGLQREVWLPSIQEQYTQSRDWMNGLSDLSVFVDDNAVLHFAEVGAYPNVYLNQTTDIDNVEPTDTPNSVNLDTYDSQNYTLRKIGLYGIPYPRIEAYTKQSSIAVRLQEAKTCAYAIAPDVDAQATYKKIIIPTTGDDNGSGYRSARIEDIILLQRLMDQLIFPETQTGRHLVLPSSMWWELVLSNKYLELQMALKGKIEPIMDYYGLQIHRYDSGLGYDVTANQKAALGTIIANNVVPFGFGFCTRESWLASGVWTMFDRPILTNTRGRAYEFGFQHRFKAGLFRTNQKYSFGIYAAKI